MACRTNPRLVSSKYEIFIKTSNASFLYQNARRLLVSINFITFNFSDKIGKEVITRYSSNLKSNGEFYTDSNGREMLKRKLNYRPTWDVKLLEPVAGNYYPITSKISIEDKNTEMRLSAIIDRAQGGSSLSDGEIELMVNLKK